MSFVRLCRTLTCRLIPVWLKSCYNSPWVLVSALFEVPDWIMNCYGDLPTGVAMKQGVTDVIGECIWEQAVEPLYGGL
jgi:hypothetical protein